MKALSNVFEGIFNANQSNLDSSAMVFDADSELNKKWKLENIENASEVIFTYEKNYLGIQLSGYIPCTIIGKDPYIRKYLPNIQGTECRDINFRPANKCVLTPDVLGKTIAVNRININCKGVENVTVKQMDPTSPVPYSFHVKTEFMKNVVLQNGIIIFKSQVLPKFTKCKCISCETLQVDNNDLWNVRQKELENVIDWSFVPRIVSRSDASVQVTASEWNFDKMLYYWRNPAKWACYEYPKLKPNFTPDKLFPGMKIDNTIKQIDFMGRRINVTIHKHDERGWIMWITN